ncbi:hypothetical protein BC831DRAFT_450933 [Entophlyctis helioformis]|nr:hypothetical protein BC831DRAFT_450933 [Entophlyctis helioformis]
MTSDIAPSAAATPAAPMKTPAKGTPSTPAAGSSASTVTKTPTSAGLTVGDVPSLLDAGAKALAMGNYALATDKLSLASQLMSETHGPKSRECAPTLYLYGQALLANAVRKNQVLGGDSAEEAGAAGSSSAADATPSKTGHFVFEGDEDDDDEEDEAEDDNDDNQEADAQADAEDAAAEQRNEEDAAIALEDLQDDDEEADDLEIAWETFDLVRVIYNESGHAEDKAKLGEVHLALGDVSLESGNFDQAVADFVTAVRIKEEHLAPDDRELAEAHYKLALALEYSESIEDAIEQVSKTMTVLQAHLAKLKATAEAAGHGETNADRKGKGKATDAVHAADDAVGREIKEVEALLAEMGEKMDDLRATLAKEEQDDQATGAVGGAAAAAADETKADAKDVSVLVKKRAHAADEPAAAVDSPSKKAKAASE